MRRQRGFALLDLLFVNGIIGLRCMIALPRLAMAQSQAGAASAIGSLRSIGSAQLTFALTCAGGFYAPSLTVLGTAPLGDNDAFVPPSLGAADTVVRSGYRITMTGEPSDFTPETCNGYAAGETARGWVATADPTSNAVARFFAINAGNTIYEHNDTLDGDMPEVGEPTLGHVLQ